MCLKKILVKTVATALLSIAALPCFADLNITNNSNISVFNVSCSGPYPAVDIHSHQNAQFDWNFVEMVIGGLKGSCSFYSHGKLEATATIQLDPSLTRATIANLDIKDPKLQVSSNPGVLVSSNNINVVVSGG